MDLILQGRVTSLNTEVSTQKEIKFLFFIFPLRFRLLKSDNLDKLWITLRLSGIRHKAEPIIGKKCFSNSPFDGNKTYKDS